jgi:outer membrane lipoprotein SlyB
MKKIIAITLIASLVGCAGISNPVVDLKQTPNKDYQADLAECRALSDQAITAGEGVGLGSAAGGVILGLLALVLGGNGTVIAQAFGAGAITGAAGGAVSGKENEQQITKRCLKNRGYQVLN